MYIFFVRYASMLNPTWQGVKVLRHVNVIRLKLQIGSNRTDTTWSIMCSRAMKVPAASMIWQSRSQSPL